MRKLAALFLSISLVLKTMYEEKVVSTEQFLDNYFAMNTVSSIRNYLLDRVSLFLNE